MAVLEVPFSASRDIFGGSNRWMRDGRSKRLREVALIDADNCEIPACDDGEYVSRQWFDYQRLLCETSAFQRVGRFLYIPRTKCTAKAGRHYCRVKNLDVMLTPKDADAHIHAHAMDLALRGEVEVIRFVGADRDLEPFVRLLHGLNVWVIAHGWLEKTSELMRAAVDEFYPFSDDLVLQDPLDVNNRHLRGGLE